MRLRFLTAALCGLFALLLIVDPAVAATIHTVARGETLSAISRRYDVPVEALVQANNLPNPNFIYVGQRLTIPTGSNDPDPSPPAEPAVYVVRVGDTLYRIATRYGTTVAAITDLNNIPNPNFIYVGLRLNLPGDGPAPAPTAVPTTPPTQPTPAPTTPPTQPTPTPAPTTLPPTPTLPPPTPTSPPAPTTGQNLLPNPSFENGWYNQNGTPELQLPNGWRLTWETGPTGFGNEAWDVWVRPEVRVLSRQFLPPEEHGRFIYSGDHTVKIFKGNGAVSTRLLTDVYLPAGTYQLTINVFPDLVVGYEGGDKIWAPDPLSGDVNLIGGDSQSGWQLPVFGRKNTFRHTFTVNTARSVTVGAAIRGRFAIANNGWFVDDWSLEQVR